MNLKNKHSGTMTLAEIRREGFQALLDRLGPAGAIRFLRQYDLGRGDYTRDRHLWLDSVEDEEILASIKQRQEGNPHASP